MTLNETTNTQTGIKQSLKSEDLDMIANFMDTILNNMKERIQIVQVNKTKDNSSFSSDFGNLMSENRKEMISDIDRPMKFAAANKLENSNNSMKEATQRKNPVKNRIQSAVQPNQKKSIQNSNLSKPNNLQNTSFNSAQKPNNSKPIQKKISPKKISIKENNNQVNKQAMTRSVSMVLKQINQPYIETVHKITNYSRPNTANKNVINNRIYFPSNSIKKSLEKHIPVNLNNQNKQIKSNSKTKPANKNFSSLAAHLKTRSNINDIPKNTNVKQNNLIVGNTENKKPSLYITPLQVMEKHIRRNNVLKPVNINSSFYQNNQNNNKTSSMISKQIKNMKPVTVPLDNRTRRSHPKNNKSGQINSQQNNKVLNEKIQTSNQKQINVINRNFQSGKNANETARNNQIKLSTGLPSSQMKPVFKNNSANQKLSSIPKNIKNIENITNITQDQKENKHVNETKKEPEKLEVNKKEKQEETSVNISEMGDSTVQQINERIQDIIGRIKEQKELNTQKDNSNFCNISDENIERCSNLNIKNTEHISEEKSSNAFDEKFKNLENKIEKESQNNEDVLELIEYNIGKESPNKTEKESRNNEKKLETAATNKNASKLQLQNIKPNVLNKQNRHIIKPVHEAQIQKPNIIANQQKHVPKIISNTYKLSPILSKSSNSKKLTNVASNTVSRIYSSKKLAIMTPLEIIQDYVNLANKAKRERKTFTVCGNYFSVRRSFIERGWIEKIRVNVTDDKEFWRKLEGLSNYELIEGIKDKEKGNQYRRAFLSKLLAGHQVDFYWDSMTNPFNVNNDKIKRTIINRFPFGATKSYTSKAGLSESLHEAYWYYVEGYANILFPRTYNLAYIDEIQAFIDDFRITAAISLLQWICSNASNPKNIISANGQIPTSVFNFATLQCHNYIKLREHRDIDENVPSAKEYEWDVFLEKFYKIVHQNHHFKETDKICATLIIDQSRYIMNKLKKYLPNIYYDGHMNLWLLKPNNGSRGSGIHVCRTLKYTLDNINTRKDVKYVIQKYIERPLLIHGTKFDIRQWFLVTCTPNLHIWLYKDCYLRFSSQMFDLSKLHESIHLTNNSVQCRYKNNANRSNALPEQNMWHSDTFRRYLSDIGQPYAWRNIIYKGIKECLVGLFMLCQDKLTTRVNSFELCGADFMLTDDYQPYLIEINSRPALYPSTKVTAKMCPQVLEDVVKVTVDYARNSKASTGNFELIYKDTFNYVPPKNANLLYIEGISYFSKYVKMNQQTNVDPTEKVSIKNTNEYSNTNIQKVLNIDPLKIRKDVKNTLEKILAIIHTEQNKSAEKGVSLEKNIQFKEMLSEFVDIIASVKNK